MIASAEPETERAHMQPIGVKAGASAWTRSFLAPAAAYLIVITALPFVMTVWYAFHASSLILPERVGQWVGLDNFRHVWTSTPSVLASIWLSLSFGFVTALLQVTCGLALGLALRDAFFRNRGLLAAALLPALLPPIIVGLAWKLLLQSDFGLVPYLLGRIGIVSGESILGSDRWALPAVCFVEIWQWTPLVAVVIAAALSSAQLRLIEMAATDGASPTQAFFDITFPLLLPTLTGLLAIRVVDGFREFDKVFVLTGGGPGTRTEMFSLYVYRLTFREWDLGYSGAASLVGYVVLFLVVSAMMRLLLSQPRMGAR